MCGDAVTLSIVFEDADQPKSSRRDDPGSCPSAQAENIQTISVTAHNVRVEGSSLSPSTGANWPGHLCVRFQFLCSGSDLVTKPFVGRVGGQPCMPNHYILEADQFARCFDYPN